jgi:hypothetical protein
MPVVENVTLGGGQVPTLQSVTQLSAAQINALSVTPVQLVPAPGAGKVVLVFGVAFVFAAGTILYQTSGADTQSIFYAGDPTKTLTQLFSNLITKFPLSSSFAYQPGGVALTVFLLPGDTNKAVQISAASPFDQGAIATSSLGAGGAGYVANDTGTITTGNGDATYKVLTVDGGGAVLTYQITNPGTGYNTGNGQATAVGGAQPGVGAGFTVNVLTVNLGNGTLKVVTYYQIIPVP